MTNTQNFWITNVCVILLLNLVSSHWLGGLKWLQLNLDRRMLGTEIRLLCRLHLFQSWPPVRTLLFLFFSIDSHKSVTSEENLNVYQSSKLMAMSFQCLLLSAFCNHDAIKCDNDFIKTSSYKVNKIIIFKNQKGKQKVNVDFNLIWRFCHSEWSKAHIFYILAETIFTSSSSPSSSVTPDLPLFCFFLLFTLELTFVKKRPHQSYSLPLGRAIWV